MKKAFFIIGLITILAAPCFADQAWDIMRRVYDRDDGQSRVATLSLTSFSYTVKDGKVVATERPRVKRMTFVTRDYGERGKDHKSVSVIREPKQERGIGFLQYDYEDTDRDADQWMYLSALGKVRRIVSGNDNEPKTGSYFGSEFNYEDLESFKLTDYTYTLVGSETYRGKQCRVIDAVPVPKKAVKSNYSRERLWVDPEDDLVLKSIRYNRNGKEWKIIYSGDIETIDGIRVPRKILVDNVDDRRRTLMAYESIELNRPVDDEFLSLRTLTDKGYRDRKIKDYTQE